MKYTNKMGLWSKGLERAQTGEERLGDMILDRNVLQKICNYIDGIRVYYYTYMKPDSLGYRCTYKTRGEIVEFKIFGESISINVPKEKCNIPWIMQTMSEYIYPLRRSRTGIRVLLWVIETNRLRWMDSDGWDDKDDIFLTYPKHLLQH